MKNTHKKKPCFGFTEDVIFGEIMSDKNFCKHVLQGLVPEIEIRDIHYLQKQRKIADPEHPKQKAVILDILVEDVDGNLYDFEMRHISKFKVLLCYLSFHKAGIGLRVPIICMRILTRQID